MEFCTYVLVFAEKRQMQQDSQRAGVGRKDNELTKSDQHSPPRVLELRIIHTLSTLR